MTDDAEIHQLITEEVLRQIAEALLENFRQELEEQLNARQED